MYWSVQVHVDVTKTPYSVAFKLQCNSLFSAFAAFLLWLIVESQQTTRFSSNMLAFSHAICQLLWGVVTHKNFLFALGFVFFSTTFLERIFWLFHDQQLLMSVYLMWEGNHLNGRNPEFIHGLTEKGLISFGGRKMPAKCFISKIVIRNWICYTFAKRTYVNLIAFLDHKVSFLYQLVGNRWPWFLILPWKKQHKTLFNVQPR